MASDWPFLDVDPRDIAYGEVPGAIWSRGIGARIRSALSCDIIREGRP